MGVKVELHRHTNMCTALVGARGASNPSKYHHDCNGEATLKFVAAKRRVILYTNTILPNSNHNNFTKNIPVHIDFIKLYSMKTHNKNPSYGRH